MLLICFYAEANSYLAIWIRFSWKNNIYIIKCKSQRTIGTRVQDFLLLRSFGVSLVDIRYLLIIYINIFVILPHKLVFREIIECLHKTWYSVIPPCINVLPHSMHKNVLDCFINSKATRQINAPDGYNHECVIHNMTYILGSGLTFL
jgi:hypothetical protein